MSSRRWLSFGAIAVAVHVAAMVSVRLRPTGGPDVLAPPASGESTIEIASLDEAPPLLAAPEARAVQQATESPAAAHASAGARVALREMATEAPPGTGKVVEGPTEPAPGPGPAPSSSGEGWTFNPGKPADLASPQLVAQAVHGHLDTADAPGPPTGVSQTGGVAEGLDAHDASLGLGRGGGLVVSALEAAAAGDAAPFEGKATFDVAIDASGRVSVALLNASTAAAAWAHVAEATRASIDPSRLRIPPGARGWHVVAAVEAKVQYPNGLDPKKLGTHVDAFGTRLVENKERDEAHQPPLIFDKTPGITLAHAGKVCTVRVTIGLTMTPISGGCDPSNIGGRAVRVVHGHVVSEGRM